MTDTEWLSFLDDCESRAWGITNHNLAHAGKRFWKQKARIIIKISVARTNGTMSGQDKYFHWWAIFDRKTNKTLMRGKHKNKLKATEAAEESRSHFVKKLCPNNIL